MVSSAFCEAIFSFFIDLFLFELSSIEFNLKMAIKVQGGFLKGYFLDMFLKHSWDPFEMFLRWFWNSLEILVKFSSDVFEIFYRCFKTGTFLRSELWNCWLSDKGRESTLSLIAYHVKSWKKVFLIHKVTLQVRQWSFLKI